MTDRLLEGFKKIYGDATDVKIYFAPGRVNLIGEHTDYNGGHVFPCALNLGTYAAFRKRQDATINLYSENITNCKVITLDEHTVDDFSTKGWQNYVKGVIAAFAKKGYKLDAGMDLYIYGDLPAGSGLSSSASLEVLIGTILANEYGFNVSKTDIALLAQVAENEYNGCNCGIMDQFVSAHGQKDSAVFLSTDTLDFKTIKLNLENASIVIVNSKVKHNLASSDYNLRREECNEALKILQTVVDIEHLCDLEVDTFRRYESLIKDEKIRRRAKHAIYENHRTIAGVNALLNGDIAKFGKLMKESHVSLRDDYEVSCRELDILAETAFDLPGVIGARMTGGGFGGCTVNLVKNDDIDYFISTLSETYYKMTGIEAEFYTVLPGMGAGRVL